MPLEEGIYNPKPNTGTNNGASLGAKLSDPAFQNEALNKAKALKPKPKDPIETLILLFTKLVAKFQTSTYSLLWGAPTAPTPRTVIKNTQTGFFESVKGAPKAGLNRISTFLQSGLFNILDTINSLDLCGILTYITTTSNSKPKPRPARSTWTKDQIALYTIQDKAKEIQNLIDKYLALPTTVVRSYSGVEPQAITQKQAIQDFGAPAPGETQISGTKLQTFNVYNLLQNIKLILAPENLQVIKDSLTPGAKNSILTAEDLTIISQVPGLGGSLNFIDDFAGYINQYTDYRNINNEDLQKILKKINDVRSICVTIQILDFKSVLALTGNFLGTDIRSQIQKLSQVIDPTKLLTVVKQISNQVNTFVRLARKIYSIISQLQFLIKLAIVLVKVFYFIQAFFTALPVPNLLTVHAMTATFEKAREEANKKSEAIVKRLEQINSLLSVILSFVRYLLSNAIELLVRLQVLIAKLEACEYTKDSAILQDLKVSYADLKQVKEQLEAYVLNYDGKNDPESVLFGKYSIRVVEEEITDRAIVNKRRRGIAVDPDGAIITQSDLTFATNTAIIIQEVKVKLMSLGLVAPQFSVLNSNALAVIATSLDYLETNDVLSEDLSFSSLLKENLDSPDSSDESQGLGLNAFINNLSGGRRLRKRVRAALDASSTKFKNQVAQEKVNGENLLKTDNIASSVGTGSNGTLTPAQRVSYIKQLREGPIAAKIAESRLKEDEDAGGIGRKANPLTGI